MEEQPIPVEETSYTIKFKDNGKENDSSTKVTSIDDIIAEGAAYVSAINGATNVYNAQTGRGLKLGTGSGSQLY